jgi:hypothetical protein
LDCLQFDLLSQNHLLAPFGVLFSQLLTEHRNLTAAAKEETPQLKTGRKGLKRFLRNT